MLLVLFQCSNGDDLRVYCESVWFDEDVQEWVCERVSDTSDDDGPMPFLRFDCGLGGFLVSVNMI